MRTAGRRLAIPAVTVVLLALFIRNADLMLVWEEIRDAHYGLISIAIVSIFLDVLFRAIRWRHLLQPVGAVSVKQAFRLTMIGLAATSLLPARAGEVLRPYLLARREGFSATASFATVVLEMVLDLLTVAFLLAAFVWWFDPGMAALDVDAYRLVRLGGLAMGAMILAALVAMFALAGRSGAVGGKDLSTWQRLLPHWLARPLWRFAALFAQGLAVVRDPRRLAVAIAWSVPLWLCVAFAVWTTSRAFGITFPFTGSFLMLSLLVAGSFVPTPGGLGGFHAAYRFGATIFYGVSNERAIAAAIVLHAISVVPIVLVGAVYFVLEGFSVGSMGRIALAAAADGEPQEVATL